MCRKHKINTYTMFYAKADLNANVRAVLFVNTKVK